MKCRFIFSANREMRQLSAPSVQRCIDSWGFQPRERGSSRWDRVGPKDPRFLIFLLKLDGHPTARHGFYPGTPSLLTVTGCVYAFQADPFLTGALLDECVYCATFIAVLCSAIREDPCSGLFDISDSSHREMSVAELSIANGSVPIECLRPQCSGTALISGQQTNCSLC